LQNRQPANYAQNTWAQGPTYRPSHHRHLRKTRPTTDTSAKPGPRATTKPGGQQIEKIDPRLKKEIIKNTLSKAQLTAFLAKVEANPTLKLQVDEASDATAVAAIAQAEGFLFSPASLARHLRG
jgi:predicted ribosomally synthesized peptide with nif11-like leader